MTIGSIAATVLLVSWSQVQTVGQLYAVMIGIGITGAMVLYEPAFAVIIAWFTPDRRATALQGPLVIATSRRLSQAGSGPVRLSR